MRNQGFGVLYRSGGDNVSHDFSRLYNERDESEMFHILSPSTLLLEGLTAMQASHTVTTLLKAALECGAFKGNPVLSKF